MGILDFFKKKNEIVIKDIKDLPQEYKDMIYFLRPEHTLLMQESFINLYTSILIGDVLYISNMDNVSNYRSWLNKSNVKNARMIDFAYDADKGIVLKNRFGSCNTYPDAKNCKNYKIRKNTFCCIQWTGKNLQEVFDFCGGSWYFINKFFDGDWDKYVRYVREHNNIFKVWYSDDYHRCAYVGDYLVRFVDGNILIVNKETFEENFKEKVIND